MSSKKNKALGINLSSLLSNTIPTNAFNNRQQTIKNDTEELIKINPELIKANPFQPRYKFKQELIDQLAESIKSQGLIQPLTVRIKDKKYELIAGERRLRAAKQIDLKTVPVVIRNCSDNDSLAIALIENIQRAELSSIETAKALKQLQTQFNLKHEEIASLVGKSRTAITNILRLLNLHEDVQNMLHEQKIDTGHARALLNLPPMKQKAIADNIIHKNLSVRQVEALTNGQKKQQKQNFISIDSHIQSLQSRIEESLLTKVSIKHSNKSKKGQIVIHYNNLDQLDGILDKIAETEEV